MGKALATAVAVFIGVTVQPATAQVRDATYRGTLVCGKIPFIRSPARSAIDVTIAGNSAKYTHAVIISGRAFVGTENGTGTVDGGKITLKGNWKGDKHAYSATYSGSFVRRSAKLTGVQVWTHEGKTQNRECTGAIKRPLAPFLPRKKNS
jgi:hypothetical protein